MKQFFNDYFTFNKRERRGILVLLLIILLLIVVVNVTDLFYPEDPGDFSQFDKEINDFSRMRDSLAEDNDSESGGMEKKQAERFYFNPNNLSTNDWMRLGLTGKQATVIKNYEAAGGNFRNKEDLKKLHVISEEFYHSVKPYIEIPDDTAKNHRNYPFIKTEKKTLEVDINHADSALFIKLKGIGTGYAKRIIRYRESLGGFARIDQIMEVYGLPPQLFDSISQYLTIDTAGIIKKNINTSTAEELKKHPYIKWNLANAIVAYRQKHGPYRHVFDVRNTDLVDEDLYRKLAPYLSTE